MAKSPVPRPPVPHLSKSRFLGGLQCSRQLWLAAHEPGLGEPPDAARQAVIESGQEVGRAAHALFPGGVLVDEPPWRHGEAEARTRALLADPSVPAIFEGAFTHAGVRIRVDALERLGPDTGRFGLREVKAATSLKEEHVPDVAIQGWVLEGAGLAVPSLELVHIDGDFVRGEGPIDWDRFFVRADVRAAATAFLRDVPARLAEMRRVLAAREAPPVEPSGHCFTPWECPFWSYCTAEKPPAWHLGLRRAGEERRARWLGALASGRPWLGPELGPALAALEPPLWYLDFESAMPAIPLYAGTRPYEQVPFLFSLHRLGADGRLQHVDFLAGETGDPRPALAGALVDALREDAAPIAVWSGYEDRMLAGLAEAVPRLGVDLAGVRERLVDLLAIVRGHAYHPGFEGSYSLKAVAPALAPGFGYADLEEVADGATASAVYARLAAGGIQGAEAARLRAELRAYCRRDTEALAEVHRALRELAGRKRRPRRRAQ